MLLIGQYQHQLDDKNRLRIPAKFHKALVGEYGEKTYSFLRGKNNCICVMSDDMLDEKLAKISEETLGKSSPASSMVFSYIYQAEEDAQGRVILPSKLKEIAGIKKDILTIGKGSRLEIWDPENYERYIAGVDYDAELEKLGI